MTAELSAFAVLAFVSCFTPGPNNALAAATGARFGAGAGLVLASGVTAGCTALVLLAALGVAGLVTAHAWLARALALVSAAYLLWLGARLLRSGAGPCREAARPPRFTEALALQFVNPKGWALALSGTSLVLAPADARGLRLAAMCLLQALICFASVLAWLAVGVRLQRWLASPARQRVFNAAMALALAGCAAASLAAAFHPPAGQ